MTTSRQVDEDGEDYFTFKTTTRNPKFSSTIFKAEEMVSMKCLINALMNAENTLITSSSKHKNLKPFLKALFTKIRVDRAILGEFTVNANKKFAGWTFRQSKINCYDAIEIIRIDITGSDNNQPESTNNDEESREFFNFRKLPKSDFVEVTIYRKRFHSVDIASRDTETKILFSDYKRNSTNDAINFPDREILMKSLHESASSKFDVTSHQIAD